jgi:hypothetical protein
MPIEIKELVIKATVSNQAPRQNGSTGSVQANGSTGSSSPAGSNNDRDEIIEACVERVLQILKDKIER